MLRLLEELRCDGPLHNPDMRPYIPTPHLGRYDILAVPRAASQKARYWVNPGIPAS